MIKILNTNELKQAEINRQKLNKKNKLYLNGINTDWTIISSNCIGGIIYHDLGLQFKSPTINLYFNCHDFGKFINNLNFYLGISPIGISNDKFPILKLGDITLFCQHYKSCEEAIDAWERRKKRIIFERIFVIATDRDCESIEDLKLIDNAPYDKIIFVSSEEIKLKNGIWVEGYDKQVGHLDRFVDETGVREYEKYLSLKKIFK